MTSTANAIPQPAPAKFGGRPRLAVDQVRARTIGVRVNAAELAILKSRAAAGGVTPGDLLRSAALALPMPPAPVPEANRAEYAHLAGLANNLNQITRAVNSGLPVMIDSTLLEAISVEVSQLRFALLTGE